MGHGRGDWWKINRSGAIGRCATIEPADVNAIDVADRAIPPNRFLDEKEGLSCGEPQVRDWPLSREVFRGEIE